MKAKDTTFTLKIEAELRERFMAVVAEEDRSASQVVRELMRQYVAERAVTPEYREYLQKKVDIAREQMRQGLGRSNAEVEADFAKLRESWS